MHRYEKFMFDTEFVEMNIRLIIILSAQLWEAPLRSQ